MVKISYTHTCICPHCMGQVPIFSPARQKVFDFILLNPGCSSFDIIRAFPTLSKPSLSNILAAIRTEIFKTPFQLQSTGGKNKRHQIVYVVPVRINKNDAINIPQRLP